MPTNRIITSSVLRKFALLCDCSDIHYTDCFIVSTFIKQNGFRVEHNRFLLDHIIDNANVSRFIDYLHQKNIRLSLEDLVVFFEFVVSPQEKKVNGAVYTPEYVREYIVSYILEELEGPLCEKKFADIACGCGGFLLTLAKRLHSAGIPYVRIFRECLYGVDIAKYSIDRACIMLSLLAQEEEDLDEYCFNLIQADSLCFEWQTVDSIRLHGGFDAIVGNPPYVGASKIDKHSLELMKRMEVSQTGKADLYIPFFQIGIENLVENGILGYITVNNFYRSVNGRSLRHYFARKGLKIRIVDFGAEQIFQGRSTYTCLCFIRNEREGSVYYTMCNSKQYHQITEKSFVHCTYQQLSGEDAWMLSTGEFLPMIKAVRNIGIPLGEYTTIRNGFATLRNDVYIFTPKYEDEFYYYFESTDGEESVEKEICREAIKGNILRSKKDMILYKEKLIFPYKADKNNGVSPLQEDELQSQYPVAYSYLKKNKVELAQRSKSEKISPWYTFGRTQALNISGYKLLFPYIADNPYFILCEDKKLMFYNGYCIVDESIDKLRFLQKLLTSRLFWNYIKATSKPYGGEFYALAKNYIKSFGVIELSDDQKQSYVRMPQIESDRYIERMYGVSIE